MLILNKSKKMDATSLAGNDYPSIQMFVCDIRVAQS
jgi:hypothetical protein